jgi:hypothetical protein
MMRFDEALTDRPITLGKIKVTDLANRAMEHFGLFGRDSIALDLR